MKLSLIIPTYNRSKLLRLALQSIERAEVPKNLQINVIVVNNNSVDDTAQIGEEFKTNFSKTKIKYTYLFEANQGKSFAVNRGISESNADLISVLDDDMEVSQNWFVEIEKVFSERWNEIDFIGGKVLPIWEIEPPKWIAPLAKGVIGIGDHGTEEWFYGEDTPILSGGNCVLKAEIFEELGKYSVELGPKEGNLIGCEDDIFYDKLLKAKKRGVYIPTLALYHFVPKYRLSKSYYRQWCFGVGMSWHLMDKHHQFFKEVKLFGVPRYLYRELLTSIGEKTKAMIAGNEEKSLDAEREILVFSGFFYSKNIKDSKLDKPLRNVIFRKTQVIER